MSILKRPCIGAIAVAALCLCGQVADAQVAPVQYWLPSGLFGLGSGGTNANSANTYGNFPGFDAQPGDGDWRANFRTGMFARSEAGSFGLNGLGPGGASSDFGALSWQSAVTGYNFKGTGDLPVTVYAGFDKLDYRPGIGSPLAPFSSDASAAAGYRARAGIAFQPTANVTLSFEAGVTQSPSGDGDINSPLLPALSPFAAGRR
jgi:hypothetical protein